MGLKKYDRADAAIYRDPRWKAVRYLAKKRDDFKCVECGARGRLEVHHIKRVKYFPLLAYVLENLKTLCVRCHGRVTRIECGFGNELPPDRAAWRDLLATMAKSQPQKELLHYVE
ncbi:MULTISPECIES: HNH endonuclease signature motif containing protein [Rhodopseudomonas]|uniref:HNH endonuclease n=1 Tax=Rhodopseudomonas TaxID=1073 RepID=UPI0005C81043|nr:MULTISPECIES: HNH endonuclease signature motif containing protein [Rhodopseudomonas]MDF3811281.1 HNH endonuclease signature motif containing protein [Rhodopseudomonas sp. BAL398]WOK18606.1 HNH endonuclease signature motif containing protein [Rhodopseudomonas sp. BAL398]